VNYSSLFFVEYGVEQMKN